MRRKSQGGIIAAIVALVLAVALVLTCGIGSSWFTNSDIATWFNSWGKGEQTEQPAEDETPDDETGSQDKTVKSLSFKAMSTSEEVSEGVTKQITASVEPADATNKAVDWSIAWMGDVAEDISDYLTIVPSSDGSLTANVTCLQSFRGKAAIITVTARDGGAQATCMVSYKGEPVSFDINNTGRPLYGGTCNYKSSISIPVALTNPFGDVGEEYYDDIKIVEQEFVADVYTYDLDFTIYEPDTPSSISINKYKLSELKYSSDESLTADKTITAEYADGYVTITSTHYLNDDFYYDFFFNGYSGTYTGMLDHVGQSSHFDLTLDCNGIQGTITIFFQSGVNDVTVTPSITF